MSKILSDKEWFDWKGDFFWIKHSSLMTEEKAKDSALRDIILKWGEKNCKGWLTFIEGYWMFEHKQDASKIKSAIIAGYFDQDMGEIKEE